jgi:hypothetical protein
MFGLIMAVLACFFIGIIAESKSHLAFGFLLLLVLLVGGFFTLLTIYH